MREFGGSGESNSNSKLILRARIQLDELILNHEPDKPYLIPFWYCLDVKVDELLIRHLERLQLDDLIIDDGSGFQPNFV